MELIVDSDIYIPGMDQQGNYIDSATSQSRYPNGIKCPCGSRKDKTYYAGPVFTAHTKTKSHQKWIDQLNASKMNYYSETLKQADTIHSQKLVIANLSRTLEIKNKLIEILSEQLVDSNKTPSITVNNLLD
jgi:alpha-N-acetylglucosamine transferase